METKWGKCIAGVRLGFQVCQHPKNKATCGNKAQVALFFSVVWLA